MRQVLLSRVDGVANECLEKDPDILSKPPEVLQGELMRELDRSERPFFVSPIWTRSE